MGNLPEIKNLVSCILYLVHALTIMDDNLPQI